MNKTVVKQDAEIVEITQKHNQESAEQQNKDWWFQQNQDENWIQENCNGYE